MEILRKYGAATTILFPLVDRDAVDFESTPVTFASGDTKISKDEGAFANTGSNPAHEGNGIYSLALTATEMQAARIAITIIDQTATKLWEDQAALIATYGHASAQHAFDLDTAEQDVNLVNWRGTQPSILSSGQVNVDVERWRGSVPLGMDASKIQVSVQNIGVGKIDAGSIATDAITAAKIAPDAIGASELAADAADEIADAVLRRPTSSVESGWTEDDRTLYGVIAALMHKHKRDASNITLYKSNDSGVLVTIPITTDTDLNPISQIDPP